MVSPGNDLGKAANRVDRGTVIVAVTQLLGDGKPRTAREIVAVLTGLPGLADVRRRDVNSVLYTELTNRVVHDDEFKWFVRPNSVAEADRVRVAKAAVPDRGSLLRSIHRLRSGTPPSENTRDLTVGAERMNPIIGRWLSREGGPSRWLLVSGDYGDGKTHTLTFIRDVAHSLGYATCHLTADASSSALNHPQRFLPVLLGTLEFPSSHITGYEELLYQVLSDSETAVQARQAADRFLGTGRTADARASFAISQIMQIDGNASGSDEHSKVIRTATYHLSGDSTRYRPGTAATRSGTYALLQVALDLIKEQGARGLVVLLDEVESVFTKLPTVRSRLGAYRVMAALSEAPDFQDMKVALAVTPDAEKWIRTDLSSNAAGIDALACEPVEAWSTSLAARHADIRCRALRPEQRVELAKRVHGVYQSAYPEGKVSTEQWNSFLDEISSRELPVRSIVREVIDFLDSLRYKA
jgi:hypothetical protein